MKEPKGFSLGCLRLARREEGPIYSKVSSSPIKSKDFPPCSSLCEMVTGVASGQIVSMHALVGGPCKQEHKIVSSDHLSHPPNP